MTMYRRAIGGDSFYDGDHFHILQILGVLVVTVVILYILRCDIGPKAIPTVDARLSPDGYPNLIEKAKEYRIFTLNTYAGPIIILPPEYIDEIRNDRRLSLAAWNNHEFSTRYAGFEVFRPGTTGDGILQDAIKSGLSRIIGWHKVTLKSSIDFIIQRVVASVVCGPELSSRAEWLETVTTCLEAGGIAVNELRKWPPALRPLVHWFLPSCRRLRAQARQVRRITEPIIAERRARHLKPDSSPQLQYNDGLEWMERSAMGRPYDATMSLLVLFLLGTETMADLLTQMLSDLSERAEVVEAMRLEVLTVLPRQNGWRTQDLHRLRLMDSVLKESQRLKPFEFVLLRRIALDTVRLSDGTRIPKGSGVGVFTGFMCDPTIYLNPTQFDAFRFLNLRNTPGYAHSSQFVSPSASHLGFGYGSQSCPGRFFAVALVKILLVHIVMEYDIKPSGSEGIKLVKDGFRVNTDPEATLLVRRRQDVAVP
ncbi:cytochrome P450 monooxygenase [Penicillium malachiteum]|uniref:cytochrome P450 monooxygenase n=1 Tax=Penicillium malachiteum TaxID=1324776 RepID=UPI0025476A18|nr:cytochrome P450 monooxygenase [Penicillium malachiteum]KAJ5714402.1 cytochrome P450 monooxygenase [Penicillium malachiteum]